ncbi:S8 family peptidase [Kallotenue papyrolyticum]|uniref:S8 family peptidase n=1 Tax=Kallotenue papyrolyticum TaxID=1325125 RepID=UPI0009E01212|nr:S8 family peptidase [Kallotenue papyrolyticum]
MQRSSQHPCAQTAPQQAGRRPHRWLRSFGLLLALGALLLSWSVPGGRAQPAREAVAPPAVPGEFLVRFHADVSPAQRRRALAALGGVPVDAIAALDIIVARFPSAAPGASAQADAAMLARLRQHPLIDAAEPNYLVTIAQTPTPAPGPLYLPLVMGPPALVPNDPDQGRQYAWSTLGAYQGWYHNQGSPTVIIAVVDTGVQLDHPDLRDKLVSGYDLVDHDALPEDGHGHGTHVAGIAGAITNNGLGVAGTCPACRLMPVRVLNNDGSGTLVEVADGILWAAEHGAQVINLSLSGTSDSWVLQDALNRAWERGALPVCAAGNDWQFGGASVYPAKYSVCTAVAATDQADAIASFSNRGTWVELAAPGVAIYSTWIGSGYRTISGTSMATPHVAGVAGLLAAQGLNNQQIRARLCATADTISGTGTFWSCGRLNLLRAVGGP